MTRTYSLAEAAERLCGDSMKNPELWVRRKIRAKVFSARKVGHSVRMTDEDIQDALRKIHIGADLLTAAPEIEPPSPERRGVTTLSLRRRSA
jgi:hypothetical protein